MIVTRLRIYPAPRLNVGGVWPFDLVPIRAIAESGLSFDQPITFLVGENGCGKSTLLEAIAEAYGLDVNGGHGGRRYSAPSRSSRSLLGERLHLELSSVGQAAKRSGGQGFFLRSETAKGMLEYMSSAGVPGYGSRDIATISHGEGFIEVLRGRFNRLGLYLLDEPEAALSFAGCLELMQVLERVVKNGSQVICATHSPLIIATSGAQILNLNANGIAQTKWMDTPLVKQWASFFHDPSILLRSLAP